MLSDSFIEIGNVRIRKTLALAPMASVADRAYRQICKEMGASYVVSEMVSAKGIIYSDKKTAELCFVPEDQRPYAIQLFGEDADSVSRAASEILVYKPNIIDINMGCPVPKIVGNGSGSALMKDPDTAYKIIKETVKSCDVPVTVKFRSGWDDEHINAVEFAKMAQSAGASAITIHGRTRKQMYSGKADREIIRLVKEAVSIPVIGNGDIDSADSCIDMYEKTGCDLAMAGRGTYGNPWLFEEVLARMENRTFTPPTLKQRIEAMVRQTELTIKYKGERTAMSECRRQCAFYLHGMPSAAKYRARCGTLSTAEDLYKLADEIIKSNE